MAAILHWLAHLLRVKPQWPLCECEGYVCPLHTRVAPCHTSSTSQCFPCPASSSSSWIPSPWSHSEHPPTVETQNRFQATKAGRIINFAVIKTPHLASMSDIYDINYQVSLPILFSAKSKVEHLENLSIAGKQKFWVMNSVHPVWFRQNFLLILAGHLKHETSSEPDNYQHRIISNSKKWNSTPLWLESGFVVE